MAFTLTNRNTQIIEKMLMGVSAHSQKSDGTQEKISNWTPNNYKTIILCPDRLIIEFHVAPLGIMKTHFMTFPLTLVDAETKGKNTKGILSLFVSGNTRAYSNIEEIYVVQNPMLSPELQDRLQITDLPCAPSDTGEFKEKFPRLHHVAYLSPIDGTQLYTFLNTCYTKKTTANATSKDKTALSKVTHWYEIFEKLPSIKQTVLFHLNANNCYDYRLRYNYYMLDRTPSANETNVTAAQLYTHLEQLKQDYLLLLKKQKDKETNRAKYAEILKNLSMLGNTKLPDWFMNYNSIKQFSLMRDVEKDIWFDNRLHTIAISMLSATKSSAFVEHIKGLEKIVYSADTCKTLGVQTNEKLIAFIQNFKNGFIPILTPTEAVPNYKKNMTKWLFDCDIELPEAPAFSDFTKDDVKTTLRLIYIYVNAEHLSMLSSIYAYCKINGFLPLDMQGLLKGVTLFEKSESFAITLLRETIENLPYEIKKSKGLENLSEKEIRADITLMGVEFVSLSGMEAKLLETQTTLVDCLYSIFSGSLKATSPEELIKVELEKLREFSFIPDFLSKLKPIFESCSKCFRFERIDLVTLYPSNLYSKILEILSAVCTEQNDKYLKEMNISLNLKDMYYLLQGQQKYNNHILNYFNGSFEFSDNAKVFESYTKETDYKLLQSNISDFITLLSVFLDYWYVVMMLSITSHLCTDDDAVSKRRLGEFSVYAAINYFNYTRSLSHKLLSFLNEREKNTWHTISSTLNADMPYLVEESQFGIQQMRNTLYHLITYYDTSLFFLRCLY